MLVDRQTFSLQNPRGFLVIDGVNGSGKGTLISKLTAQLTAGGFRSLVTREPGGTPLGKTVRQLLLSSPELKLTPLAEVLLFSADRAQHVGEVIEPTTKNGTLVISDRYLYSTVAFQGYGRGLDRTMLTTLCALATNNVKPDITILLDLDPQEGLKRAAQRNSHGRAEVDVLEREQLEFHHRVREGFLAQARELPEPFVVLDASASPEHVFQQAWHVVEQWAVSFQQTHS